MNTSEKITIEIIKNQMILFLKSIESDISETYPQDKEGDVYDANGYNQDGINNHYDEDGYCSRKLYDKIVDFWHNVSSNQDLIDIAICKWKWDIDLEGGRSYFLTRSNPFFAVNIYIFLKHNLGWNLNQYQKAIYNSSDLTDEIEYLFKQKG